MTIDTLEKLKAANEINSLGLSDSDFARIEQSIREFRERVAGLNFNVGYALRKVGKLVLKARHWYSPHSKPHTGFRLELDDDDEYERPGYEMFGAKLLFEMDAVGLQHANKLVETFLSYQQQVIHTREHLRRLAKDGIEDEKDGMDAHTAMAVFWLFGRDLAWTEMSLPKKQKLNKILAVVQEKNDRYYLVRDDDYSRGGEVGFAVRRASPAQAIYNYVDEGRLFYKRVLFEGVQEGDIDVDVASKISNRLMRGEECRVVNREEFEEYRQRFRLEVEKDRRDRKVSEALSKELERRKEDLRKGFAFNGMRFSSHFIEYAGQKIGGEDIDLAELIRSTSFSETTDFNHFYERFVCDVLLMKRPVRAWLGSVEVTISERSQTNRLGVTSRLTLLNGVRVNNSEAQELLMRAQCFENRAAYDSLLKEVSKCSLLFHSMLNNGLRLDYWDDICQCERFLKFRVVRKGGRNYLVNGDENYLIRDSERLVTKSSLNKYRRERLDFAGLLEFFTSSFGLKMDRVIVLFKDGLRAYQEAERRSQQLLAEAIKQFGVKKATATADNKEYEGYLVKGRSKTYFLTKDLKVFDYPSMRYICIVDKARDAQLTNDKLVNRIYALANDQLVAKDISTLSG